MTQAAEHVTTDGGGERRRWYVHLALLGALAGALGTLFYLSHSITIHVIFGLLFMTLLLCHLFQRRRTVKSLARRLVTVRRGPKATGRLALSDTVLELLVANVLVSGTVDALQHHVTQLPFVSSLGLPPGLARWHTLSSVVLVGYVIVHVLRRRRRFRRSRIR